jgi:hypothetical protein
MKYSFQFVASDGKTDDMLSHISFLHRERNCYQLNNATFSLYTYLSKANVQGRIYLYSFDELELPDVSHDLPTIVFIVDIKDPDEKGFEMLCAWSTYCNERAIPFYFRKEVNERMDEMYVKAFSWLMTSVDSLLSISKQRMKCMDSVHHYLYLYHGDKASTLEKRYLYTKDKALTLHTPYWYHKAHLAHLAFYNPLFA